MGTVAIIGPWLALSFVPLVYLDISHIRAGIDPER